MVSRNFIRIKVLEAIYAYRLSHREDVLAAEKQLEHTMNEFYALYVKLLTLLPALAHLDAQFLEMKKSRMLPTEEDLQPNFKFSENRLIRQLHDNPVLEKTAQDCAAHWNDDLDILFLKPLYHKLAEQDFFRLYMKEEESSYESDKNFVLNLIEHFLLENEDCIHHLGNIRLHWMLDYNDAVILMYNTLKKYTEKQREDKALPSLFKMTDGSAVSEDFEFMRDLFTQTLRHETEFGPYIEKSLRNWEMDRVATIDMLLLEMAICEFLYMPSIPTRVTLNEYIELAKYYSTPKSRQFVNGILDNVLTLLRDENRLRKQGRGLMG